MFLSVTGGEALYADMGHFGRFPIRAAWFSIVLPCLMLNYFGQGALLLTNPSALHNPFFQLAPEWAVLPLVVLATGATVIASQAVITGRVLADPAGDPPRRPAADARDPYEPREGADLRTLRELVARGADARGRGRLRLVEQARGGDRRPDQLSGGQRQRVAIGRALVRDAAVFLFDEPLSNLDAQLRNELRDEIKRLHHRLAATTMIYVTHDQIEAMTLADRIAVMKDKSSRSARRSTSTTARPTCSSPASSARRA